ncbi:MAG: DNA polymerase/3'-5' exonuclease PolX, partial [Gemmatimonadetes bacterium]|nr:DNA polymerase/3'-5' exonuclease PolX [Gemmatimonadota bacterium]
MRRRGEKEKAAARKRKPPRERKVAREAGAPAAPPANAATRAGAGGGLGVENIEVGRMLGAVADLLEIQDANPFRVRAYRNAVRTIEGLTRPLVKMVAAAEDLTELPGIGGEMAHHITEIVTTGRLSVLDEILKKVPASLIELTLLDGLGPKRTRKLWEALGITTIDALERALDAGRVEELEGFGEKTAARIRQSIADHRRHVGRFRLVDADQFVRPLLEYMREVRGIEEMEVAGSYRRRRETVGDI